MSTFLGIFFFLQTWTIFTLLGRIGVKGIKRLVWCLLSIIPFFWLFVLVRLAFFAWPNDKCNVDIASSEQVTESAIPQDTVKE